jgi:hypothetical protein
MTPLATSWRFILRLTFGSPGFFFCANVKGEDIYTAQLITKKKKIGGCLVVGV